MIEINLDEITFSTNPSSLYNHLEISKDEIHRWFKILELVGEQDKPLILRAIAVEVFEFKLACENLFDCIRDIVNQVNEQYHNFGGRRSKALTPPRNELRDELKDPIFQKIKDARNQVAAHRYTGRNGAYISIGKGIRHYDSISKYNLTGAFEIVNRCLDEIGQWISDNHDYWH